MKRRLVHIVLIILLATCSKKSGTDKDIIPPAITIAAPLTGEIIAAGQLIKIEGTISDDKFIAEVHLHVTNIGTGVKLLDVHLYPGNNSTTFSNQSLTAVSGINYKIQVIATDRSLNQSISSVEVVCN